MSLKLKDRTKQVAIEAPISFWIDAENFANKNGYHNLSEFFNVSIHHILGNVKPDDITQDQGTSIAKEALKIIVDILDYKRKEEVDMSDIRTTFRAVMNFLTKRNISDEKMQSIEKMVERYRLNLPVIDTKGLIFSNGTLFDELLSEDNQYE